DLAFEAVGVCGYPRRDERTAQGRALLAPGVLASVNAEFRQHTANCSCPRAIILLNRAERGRLLALHLIERCLQAGDCAADIAAFGSSRCICPQFTVPGGQKCPLVADR